jgi:hypothetical protein
MADLSAVTYIHLIEAVEEPRTLPAGEAITQGMVIGFDSAGKVVKANANTTQVLPKGIALTSAGAANMPVSILRDGTVDIGNIMTGVAYGALIYASDAGILSSTIVNSVAAIGSVEPAWGGGATADKVLRIYCGAR